MSCPVGFGKSKTTNNAESSCPISSNNEANLSSSESKLKICCACPDTKKIRDECMFNKGEEFCTKEIQDHIICLRKLGFKV